MNSEEILNIIDLWSERGWLRYLDRAFAIFLNDQAGGVASAEVLLSAALTSHQLGRGHVCLDLKAALLDPDSTLSLPPEGESGEEMPLKPSDILEGVTLESLISSLQGAESMVSSEGAENTPLVLDGSRLYLRRYWRYTIDVAKDIRSRTGSHFEVPEDLPQRLDTLFFHLRDEDEKSRKEIHWQSVAAAVAARSGFTIISGGPGTGKTTTVVQILALLQRIAMDSGYKLRIHLAAPTGKAAARLTESVSGAIGRLPEDIRSALPSQVTTIHKLLGRRPGTRNFIHTSENRLNLDLLVIDEASMVDLEMMSGVMKALPPEARLILLGDRDQLASVEAGMVLGDLCRSDSDRSASGRDINYSSETCEWIKKFTGYNISSQLHVTDQISDQNIGQTAARSTDQTIEQDIEKYIDRGVEQHIVVLKKSHRFGSASGIGALSKAVNSGDPDSVGKVLQSGFDDISYLQIESTDDISFSRLVLDGYGRYLEAVMRWNQDSNDERAIRDILAGFGRFRVLTPLRKGVWGVEGLNGKIAAILHKKGLIRSTTGWYPGRPVMVISNDYGLGLMNGDIGVVMNIEGSLKTLFPMADGSLKKASPSRLSDVETVYAMTVHKSQGSEFDHTALILPDRMNPVLTRELIYTGITRAKSRLTIAGSDIRLMKEAVVRRTHRASGLGDIVRRVLKRSPLSVD